MTDDAPNKVGWRDCIHSDFPNCGCEPKPGESGVIGRPNPPDAQPEAVVPVYDEKGRLKDLTTQPEAGEEIVLHRNVKPRLGFIPGIDDPWEQCPGRDYHETCDSDGYEHAVATIRRKP